MKKLLLSLALILGMGFSQVQAQQAGEEWILTGYCLDEEHARVLSRAMASDGIAGFRSIMADPQYRCFHTKLHGLREPQVELVEEAWQVEVPDGTVFQFWKVKDSKGTIGWSWLSLGDPV